MNAGGIDYITKPINKVELIARIKVALRLKEEKDWHAEQDKHLKDELDLAMQVQRTLLSKPIKENCLSITSSYKPAHQLAGDLYYWYKIDDHRYSLMLLDVMGHGISASLVCMFISSKLRDLMQSKADPETVMQKLNELMRYLNKDGGMQHYFTAIYLVLDCAGKTVEYVNAGHPPAFALVDGAPPFFAKGLCFFSVNFFISVKNLIPSVSTVHTVSLWPSPKNPRFVKLSSNNRKTFF